jgi:hypothetical protein
LPSSNPAVVLPGNLLELLLASDRSYMINDPEAKVEIALDELNGGSLPMSNGLTRCNRAFSET